MSDARVLRRRYVRTAAAGLGGALALAVAGGARAEEAAGSASISVGADTSGTASASAESPAADQPPAQERPLDPRKQNPANYEFAFVSVAAYQTWSLAGSVLFFGAGGGLGPTLYRISKIGSHDLGWDPDLEIAYANVFLRFSPLRYVDLDVGPKIALGSALFNVPDAPQSTFSYGGYVDLRIGSKTIKLGPRFEYDRVAHNTLTESGWRLTPIMLRVMHY